jgi:hypothetical protein
MRFGIRHLLWLMFVIALVFAVFDRIEVERRLRRSEAYYAIAKGQNDQMRSRLDETDPTWRKDIHIAPKFEKLPEPAAWAKDARYTSTSDDQ